ncbi:transmembrane emp24 domain-containing protein 5 [Aplysia californica]|uniref:Transmembrane emp24 domain-containing protein 5 n=1 Tax=Aplysia californica TaxID=6500 RepID=A0ABM0ZZP7_APLCA|nr:transmembrane emp24 domain-containing protein 5 [Aplysia californica]
MVDIMRTTREILLLQVAFFLSKLCILSAEKVLGVENSEFDFDGLPGAQHEFKVDIPGSTEDCFFQAVSEGAQMHVSFEVLKGGDKNVDFYVRDQNWQVMEVQNYKQSGTYNLENARAGTYAICIDNVFSRFGTKLVYIYIVTFVMQEWVQFQMELSSLHLMAANFTTSLNDVQSSVEYMKQSQAAARFHVIRDWYLVQGNNYYVFMWSLIQCALILIAGAVQVFTVRRLFRTTNVTPSAKPRA